MAAASGSSARSWSSSSASRRRDALMTCTPASSARCATSEGVSFRPLPDGASGRVNTATTSCWEASTASREGMAVAGVPAKINRTEAADLEREAPGGVRRQLDVQRGLTRPLGLADGFHRQLALLAFEPVDEEDAVQVIGLVLHAAGQQLGALDRDGFTVHVRSFGDHAPGPLGREREAGKGQAAFFTVLLLVAKGEDRVDQVPGHLV